MTVNVMSVAFHSVAFHWITEFQKMSQRCERVRTILMYMTGEKRFWFVSLVCLSFVALLDRNWPGGQFQCSHKEMIHFS